MIVYHGSNSIVVHPDIVYSRKSTDFSTGFYLTTIKEQALFWARKRKMSSNEAYINQYSLNENELAKLNVLKFDSYNLKWLKFVSNCRIEKDTSTYDVVIGPLANDRIYDSLNLFFSGLISEKQTIEKIKIYKPTMQICIRNNEAIEKLLKFESAEAI